MIYPVEGIPAQKRRADLERHFMFWPGGFILTADVKVLILVLPIVFADFFLPLYLQFIGYRPIRKTCNWSVFFSLFGL